MREEPCQLLYKGAKNESPTDKLSSMTEIPVVSFAAFRDGDKATRTKIGKLVVDACHSVGFVSITDHLISPSRLDESFAWTKKLYDLSEEDKAKAPHPPGYDHHRGYSFTPLVVSEGEMKGHKVRLPDHLSTFNSSLFRAVGEF